MFGDMFSQMQQQQEALQQKLAAMRITEANDGVSVTISAAREVIECKISAELMEAGDGEQIEDLLVITLNRALEKGAEIEQTEAAQLMSGMMPGGMPDMGALFGK